ncbi:hypothetical protein, partial [Burkholderia pseudomallei]|uniref:hypothetical protein n=1 Tax=Burkholderia pseudomallei TaxID=28450 RepID=UPI0011AF5C81
MPGPAPSRAADTTSRHTWRAGTCAYVHAPSATGSALPGADGAWTYASVPARHVWREIVSAARDGAGRGLVSGSYTH